MSSHKLDIPYNRLYFGLLFKFLLELTHDNPNKVLNIIISFLFILVIIDTTNLNIPKIIEEYIDNILKENKNNLILSAIKVNHPVQNIDFTADTEFVEKVIVRFIITNLPLINILGPIIIASDVDKLFTNSNNKQELIDKLNTSSTDATTMGSASRTASSSMGDISIRIHPNGATSSIYNVKIHI